MITVVLFKMAAGAASEEAGLILASLTARPGGLEAAAAGLAASALVADVALTAQALRGALCSDSSPQRAKIKFCRMIRQAQLRSDSHVMTLSASNI